jgi:chaperone modulatory protein CbpM
MSHPVDLLEAHLVGEADWIAIGALCRMCHLSLEMVVELAELGVVSPRGYRPDEWQLPATSVPRLRRVGRLVNDLGVNVSGAALAVELLESRHDLERRLRELERRLGIG